MTKGFCGFGVTNANQLPYHMGGRMGLNVFIKSCFGSTGCMVDRNWMEGRSLWWMDIGRKDG